MKTRVIAFLNKPYPLSVSFSKNLFFIAGFSIFVTLFLILFQPLGLSRFQHPNKNFLLMGVGGVCFLVLSANTYLVPKTLRKAFVADKWKVGREIVWDAWLCLSTIFVLAIYWASVTGITLTFKYLMLYTLNSLVFTVFFMPFCVMLNTIRLMRKKLQRAEEISRRLQTMPNALENKTIELHSETGKERLKLRADRLLFIQSCDNYANIVRKRNGKVEEILLRSSLKNLENQLSLPYVVRCHRSFIVNLSRVRSVVGNARNYTLSLENCDTVIPVSRDAEKEVLRLLEDINVE
ncbi:LytTR family transcriptional regulator [candidate division KSB1 bacterium]|nr:LytTR family transcriptional regulator [candidate division KSB1 bacterium]NIR68924.1 LytTR family transcriptional regulator [candidate division KSB1 bacterium]NIS22578.1 LytTR family transcriptional regulator [candidate division KSB1 bacterium]NIT69426.1 LytTR family transcriptional regulator [candidate division KSB1 bacterium]NIU23081.1 LytTR family transcriptional regulator [candidate division KSB1 bacterium]